MAWAYCPSVMCERAPQVLLEISAASAKARSCNPDSGLTATAECTGHMAPTVRAAASTAIPVAGVGEADLDGAVPLIRTAVSITTGVTNRRSQPRVTATMPSRPAISTATVIATAPGPANTPGSGKICAQTPSTTT